MNWFTALASYLILWWLALFILLPIGVRGQAEEEAVEAGTEPGAPIDPLMIKKAVGATVLAALMFLALYQIIYGGWLTWERMGQWMGIRE